MEHTCEGIVNVNDGDTEVTIEFDDSWRLVTLQGSYDRTVLEGLRYCLYCGKDLREDVE